MKKKRKKIYLFSYFWIDCKLYFIFYFFIFSKISSVFNISKIKSNYRVFDDNDINWIKSLSCLKNCGMSIVEMKEYLDLYLKGESSIPERQDILDTKLHELEYKKQ